MTPGRKRSLNQGEALKAAEVRIIADLRIMHAKVDELYHIAGVLQQRHTEGDIHAYADAPVLAEDIRKVDELYLWFVKLKRSMNGVANGTR
ncbi:MAG: hypothetical protein ACR2IF_18730 [Terriglobales bacterium]